MSIFFEKRNSLFDAALSKVEALNNALQADVKTHLEQNKFFKIEPQEENSPLIMGMGGNKHLIYYPKNSFPYLHSYETLIKYIEVLDGTLFDELTGRVFKKGEKFKIYPGEEIKPYTKNSEAYVRVCVSNKDTLWDLVCK